MSENGLLRSNATDGHVLRWSDRVVTADELRRSLNGHREIVVHEKAIITPLAAEALRASGIQVSRQAADKETVQPASAWGYGQDRPYPLVRSVVQALERDGLAMSELPAPAQAQPCQWARALAHCVAKGACKGGVLFCQDAGLTCCVANKVSSLRAVAVASVAQAARALSVLAPNLVAIEMPGRTFFELRQMLRCLCSPSALGCPDEVACTLEELDGHAHR
jgi:ribose 5-phosphate isomerase RpiB